MTRIRLAAAALNQTPMAWDANRRHVLSTIAAAREAGVGVLCLPELCLSGYGCEDMFQAPGVQRTANPSGVWNPPVGPMTASTARMLSAVTPR